MRAVVALLAILLALVSPGVAAAGPRPSHLQVVAHPDDDMLFMSPDVALALRSRARVTTVFLTAGESDVRPPADYAASRQAGTRAAFAAMAGAADDWTRSALDLPGGRRAELQRLRERPEVALVFLALPDDNDPDSRHALSRLWRDPAHHVPTVPATGSVVPATAHDRDSVIAALRRIVAEFAPTLVRTQDPRPDPRYQGQWGAAHDHPDHVATARFTETALRGTDLPLLHYRDYNVADAPPNLPERVVAAKRAVFARYAEHDPQVSLDAPYDAWLASMRLRRPWGTRWATTDQQVHVRGNRLVRTDSGVESVVDTPGFVPREGSVSFAGPDRFVVQERDNGAVWLRDGDRWLPLGAPPPREPGVDLGPPSAVPVGDHVLVAVRDRGGGVSVRDAGGWCRLGGTDVADEVSAVLDGSGEVHVLAASRSGLRHWRLTASGCGQPLASNEHPVGGIAVTRGYAAFRDSRGDLVVLAEQAGWRRVRTVDAEAISDPAIAPGPVLAIRNADGLLEIIRPDGGRTELGPVAGPPALTPDGDQAAALADDGLIRTFEVD
ncbi:PIG-L family deacetylase [Saccharopolyspora flava]|uniref:N-acetylglucosaminyl deacetylase, LmbE family n=1 Tax=Saccharopolyspora flava TaxID=95161 RepID=A0A1I6U2B9_9PSEU|nr:PIG-L family deacetylase [Saccharopolyspora flava]SFS95649.1 N-acetylglucosaminyl deacetylase, LmbE family [Saccharopolyspora flava]